MNAEHLVEKIASILTEKNLTIATAESCTGGLLAHTLTNISGSSVYFNNGFITYSNTAKQDFLEVSKEILKKYGAVSEQTAKIMAINVQKFSHVDIGLSTTGIAGPTGGTSEKPVGLVYISLATPTIVNVKKFIFKGTRLENKQQACDAALEMLLEYLESLDKR